MSGIGGDITQLKGLQTNFGKQADAITALMAAIDSDLATTYWIGPAADRFKDSWNTSYKSALSNLRGSLTDAGTEVGRRADALIQAGS